jgi:hypothetical protein
MSGEIERALGWFANTARDESAKACAAAARAELAALQADNVRLQSCMKKAGMIAFMHNGTPEEVADHYKRIMDENDAENARLAKAIKEARRAVLRNPDSIAKSVYLRQEAVNILDAALSTPAPAGAVVTLAQLREIEWAGGLLPVCPACHYGQDDGPHAQNCWLAAAILDAEGEKP